MNLIGITQGASIDLFLTLVETLKRQQVTINRVGAWVSLAKHFVSSKAVAKHGRDVCFAREWEVMSRARRRQPDFERLRHREASLSAGALWSSVIADRRLIYGKRSKFTHDTRVHFSDRELGAILQEALERIDCLFEEVQPDAVIGFTPVTFGETLVAECARARGVPCLMLHSTRIRNYFALFDGLTGPSSHFLKLMEENSFSNEVSTLARTILAETQAGGVIYEGVILGIREGRPLRPLAALCSLPRSIVSELYRQIDPVLRRDHHDPGALTPWFYEYIHQPLRARSVARVLARSGRSVPASRIKGLTPFAFYPMHSEPEVALQVLGRPYHKDQIELLRNLGASLPAGYTLLVKEHPRSFGLRPRGYYRRLMEIPNLRFAPVEMPTASIALHAHLVAVVSGTVGLEAAILGKPVLVLGHPKYGPLPKTMVRCCYDLFQLPSAIRELLATFRYDEAGLVRLLSALVAGSVDIDVYSVLLNKPDRYSTGREGQTRQQKLEQDYDKLARYTMARLAEQRA